MPYISKQKRYDLDYILTIMEKYDIKANGDLNYLLFKYCKYNIPKDYNSLKNFIGELNQCATEIERKILSVYEDEKIKENGDV